MGNPLESQSSQQETSSQRSGCLARLFPRFFRASDLPDYLPGPYQEGYDEANRTGSSFPSMGPAVFWHEHGRGDRSGYFDYLEGLHDGRQATEPEE